MNALKIQKLVTIFVWLDQIVRKAAAEKYWLLRITTRNMMKVTVKDFIIMKCLMSWWIFCMPNTMKWTNITVILLTFTFYKEPLSQGYPSPEILAQKLWAKKFLSTVLFQQPCFGRINSWKPSIYWIYTKILFEQYLFHKSLFRASSRQFLPRVSSGQLFSFISWFWL